MRELAEEGLLKEGGRDAVVPLRRRSREQEVCCVIEEL